MKRSIPILLTLAAVIVCGLLAPVTAAAQKENSGVVVKRDGDSIVLIPQDPGKVFLVLGCPRAGRGQAAAAPSGSLSEPAGEQRISVKEYSKVFVLEVQRITEVDLAVEPSGLQVAEKTRDAAVGPAGKPCACDFPIPPSVHPTNPGNPVGPVPVDPEPLVFLVRKASS